MHVLKLKSLRSTGRTTSMFDDQEQQVDVKAEENRDLSTKSKKSGRSLQRDVKTEVKRELDTIRGIRTPNRYD